MKVTQPLTVPAAWIAHIAAVAARFSVTTDRLLAGQGLSADELLEPSARVSINTLVEVVERARALTREPGLGILLGLRTRATLWGNLGFATLSAATVRDALGLAVRFVDIVTPALGLRLRHDGDMAALTMDERADFGPARDAILFWNLLGIWQVGGVMTGAGSTVRLELMIDEPQYLARWQAKLPSILFKQPSNRLLFDSSRLDLAYVLHDPVALRTAIELCEKQRDALGLGDDLAKHVRELLGRKRGAFSSLKEVADSLHLSSRTLTRRLTAMGTSYQALVEDERRERALTLVLSLERSLSEIADKLGYSNVANFERAFRRWTGSSPTQYRRAARKP